jgi:hypothetical protein
MDVTGKGKKMRYYCSLSDYNYLKYGKALFKSLKETSTEKFILYYLCIDDASYNSLLNTDERIVPIKLEEVLGKYENLREYKKNNPYNAFCWSLASSFSKYLLENKKINSILYIDSDIYFYQDPKIIFEEIGGKSIGIIRHRHNTSLSVDGEFNVGIVYFKNDEIGLKCLNWWSDAILLGTNPELSSCGDQKYLEGFIPRFGDNVHIIEDTIAHGAPWNFRLYVYDYYDRDGTVIWGDKKQPLVFNHFSKFGYDQNGNIMPDNGIYDGHTFNGAVYRIPQVTKMYIDYHNVLMDNK